MKKSKNSKSRFHCATISIGNETMVYTTIPGFRKGLKSLYCPFEVNIDGRFSDDNMENGKLLKREWSMPGGRKAYADIEIRD